VHKDVVVGTVAAKQHGLVTSDQAYELGLTRGEIDRRVRTKRWRRLRRGVFALPGTPDTYEQRVLAVVLRAGPDAVASHFSASVLHGFPDAIADSYDVTVVPGYQRRIPGVRVHRPGLLAEYDRTVLRGIPVTTYARTLVDCSAWMSLGQLARALDAGLVRRHTTLWSVDRSLSVLAAGPNRQPSKLRLLLEERGTGTLESESRPEIRLLRLIVGAGLSEPVQQHRVRAGGERFRLDFAYPDQKVAVEYDGWDWHSTRTAFDRDRRRDRLLQLAGWTVLRFTSRTSDVEILDTLRAFVR
jgi:hypothetical protein